MDFGKVLPEELANINFELPPDPVCTTEVLRYGIGGTKFYLGTAVTKDKLNIYAEKNKAIELNGTYYSVPTLKQVELWDIAVPFAFKYAPKFPQVITHTKRLVNVSAELEQFLTAILPLRNKIGGLIFMPHPQIGVDSLGLIESFLKSIPHKWPVFTEVRGTDWFKNGYHSDLYVVLQSRKQGTIITDSAGRRDAVHMHLTIPQCFIRFVGNALHETDYARIDHWVERLKKWSVEGLENCYFFIHQEEYADSLVLLDYMRSKLF